MPRNRTTNSAAFVQLQSELKRIKDEMNPSIKTYRPPAQPSPIKSSVDSRWSYARFRVRKPASPAGGIAIVTAGDIAAATGLAKVDFLVDRASFWLLGSTDYQGAEMTVETGQVVVSQSIGFSSSDFGTSTRPPAVGIDIPRALAVITSGASSATTGTAFSVSQPGTGVSTSAAGTIVADLWVLYRVSS